MIRQLILKNRSYRRFYQDVPVTEALLRDLVDLARLSASAANRQPLKYILSSTPDRNGLIFPYLSWAGYLEDWAGPAEGERPAAYVVVLGDTTITRSFGCDYGIAAQSILLGATEAGLGGCIIASINRDGLSESLRIPLHYEVLIVLALGKPRETVVVETVNREHEIKYWRDSEGVHHVPKRPLDEVIIG